jgi:hypothetical protein
MVLIWREGEGGVQRQRQEEMSATNPGIDDQRFFFSNDRGLQSSSRESIFVSIWPAEVSGRLDQW